MNNQIITNAEAAYPTHVDHGDNAFGQDFCEGVDNVCKEVINYGVIDDGVANLVSATDVGKCQTEIQSCIDEQFVVTQPGITESPEVCDTLDDDCDGTADDADANATCADGVEWSIRRVYCRRVHTYP